MNTILQNARIILSLDHRRRVDYSCKHFSIESFITLYTKWAHRKYRVHYCSRRQQISLKMGCKESNKKFLTEYKIKTMICDRGVELQHWLKYTRVLVPQTSKKLPKGLHLGEHHSTYCFKSQKKHQQEDFHSHIATLSRVKHIHRTKSSPCTRFSKSEHLQFRESVPQNLAGGQHKEFIKVNWRRMSSCRILETNHFGVIFFMYLIPPKHAPVFTLPSVKRCFKVKKKYAACLMTMSPCICKEPFNLPPCFHILHWTHEYNSSFHPIPIHIFLTSWFPLKKFENWTNVLSHMHLSIQRIKKIFFHVKRAYSHQKTFKYKVYPS